PCPQACNITQITGTTTFVVDWSCEAYARMCVPAPEVQNRYPILSNRWQQSQTYDEDLMATRSASGVIRVVPTSLSVPVRLDDFRDLCMPKLEYGWKRKSCHFGVSTDGLSLTYQIEDEELNTAVPNPATSINGTYSEITSSLATQHHAEISV